MPWRVFGGRGGGGGGEDGELVHPCLSFPLKQGYRGRVGHLHLHRLLAHGRVEQEVPRDGLDPHHHHEDGRQEAHVEQDPVVELSETPPPSCSLVPPARRSLPSLPPTTRPHHPAATEPGAVLDPTMPAPTPLASFPTRRFHPTGSGACQPPSGEHQGASGPGAAPGRSGRHPGRSTGPPAPA